MLTIPDFPQFVATVDTDNRVYGVGRTAHIALERSRRRGIDPARLTLAACAEDAYRYITTHEDYQRFITVEHAQSSRAIVTLNRK